MADDNTLPSDAQTRIPQTDPTAQRPITRRRVRVTDEGLDNYLSDGPNHFPTPDNYEFGDCGIHHPRPHGNGFDGGDSVGISSGGDHVGRDLTGKTQPLRPLDDKGPDPVGDRHFYADEFQGMLTFDRKGAPTVLSRFPEAKSLADIKELRINIATTIPAYMQGDTQQAEEMELMEADAFGGHPFEDVFARVDDKMVEQVTQYAKEFEQAYGIKMTVGFDLEDAHLSLMGYTTGDADLLGFASFPPGINDWGELRGLGSHPGYLVMNNQYTANATDKEVYDLFAHEFGHTMGLAHPHDLALLNMGKREALTATKMAYTDLKLRAFRHTVTDANGKPVLDKDGKPTYYHTGPDEGVLDFGFRKWTPTAPVLGHVSNPDASDPQNDLYKGVYDMAAHVEFAVEDNARSLVYRRERLLPMVPMINDGKHTVLKGTPSDDYIDTNPGYASIVNAPRSRASQKFVLVEGHMEKVMGIGGNNVIVAAEKGEQEIHPGPGKNELRMLYPTMEGTKTIISEGTDTLMLSEDMLDDLPLTARQTKDGITLEGKTGSIVLGGAGIQNIRIVSGLGRTLVDMDVQGMDAAQLNSALFKNNVWKKAAPKEEPVPKPAATAPETPAAQPATRDNIPPAAALEGTGASTGWQQHVRARREASTEDKLPAL